MEFENRSATIGFRFPGPAGALPPLPEAFSRLLLDNPRAFVIITVLLI